VSVGHKVDLPSALRWVQACCAGYRMPEPTRLAHQAAAGRLEEREPEQTPAGAYQAAFF
ncbi:MAG: endonuclease V, partial [Chloroflexi bacterium]|nr:endonuclease V [Chloroflexota bacterium]